ncbi:hypothetical protein ACPXB3_21550 [Gordonia sp. DT219]|uniref:hypothetical protein n=1 Tax=Gordonia sp. DT219 TaxID=3416658 RepID=UPI003CE9EE93
MALLNSGALGGSPTRRTGAPTPEEVPMALKEYDVEINGVATTLQLSDEDAKVRGLTPRSESKAAPAARNKAKVPVNKAAG